MGQRRMAELMEGPAPRVPLEQLGRPPVGEAGGARCVVEVSGGQGKSCPALRPKDPPRTGPTEQSGQQARGPSVPDDDVDRSLCWTLLSSDPPARCAQHAG